MAFILIGSSKSLPLAPDLSQGMANSQMEPWNNLWADLSQGMANSQMEPWNNLWADLSQGMANSQMEPWNNLWADLSQGMANSQMEPCNNLWADLRQGMANSQMEPWNNLWADLSQGMANSQMEPWEAKITGTRTFDASSFISNPFVCNSALDSCLAGLLEDSFPCIPDIWAVGFWDKPLLGIEWTVYWNSLRLKIKI